MSKMYFAIDENGIKHFGIKGMKWGIRRFQNEDGSLTPEGKRRYGSQANFEAEQKWKASKKQYQLGTQERNKARSEWLPYKYEIFKNKQRQKYAGTIKNKTDFKEAANKKIKHEATQMVINTPIKNSPFGEISTFYRLMAVMDPQSFRTNSQTKAMHPYILKRNREDVMKEIESVLGKYPGSDKSREQYINSLFRESQVDRWLESDD